MLLLLLACNGKSDDSGDPPPLSLDDTAEQCADHAPVVTALEVVDGGMANFEGEKLASVILSVTASDDDGDLDRMAADFWWDSPPDGAVSAEGTPDVDGDFIVVRDLPCGVSTATYNLRLPLQASSYLAPDTEYDIGVIVEDAHSLLSEKFVITARTPTGGS